MLKLKLSITALIAFSFLIVGCKKSGNNNDQGNSTTCNNVVVNWGSTQIKMCTDYVKKITNGNGNNWHLFAYNSTGTPVHSMSIVFDVDILNIGVNYSPSNQYPPLHPSASLFFMYNTDIQATAQYGSDSWVKISSIINGKFSGQFKMTAIGRFASVPSKDTTINITGSFTDVKLYQ